MQPRTIAFIITILPLLISHSVYILSARNGYIPWCIPYLDGCTTISQAARSGNSIFIFRGTMMAYCILMIWFWLYSRQWLELLHGHRTKSASLILWLGIIGALFLIVYIDFLGTTGEVNRFMRRHGIMVFFTFTPLAQLLLLKQHYNFYLSAQDNTDNPASNRPASIKSGVLRYQLVIVLLMLIIGVVSILLDLTQHKTTTSENIVEWNFSLLLNMYFLGMVFIWKDYRYYLKN